MSKLIWKSVPRIRLRPRRHLFSSCIPACTSSLFVRSTMAATLDGMYEETYIVSPINLELFLRWAMAAEEADIDRAMQTVYLIDHRMDGDDVPASVPMFPVIIQRESLNRTWVMNHRPCIDPACHSCASGRGGYQFRWVGPWTCCATIGDEYTTPHELYERVSRCRCRLHP